MDKGRILIVDDNPKNIQILASVLNDAGYEIEIGMSGREAILQLEQYSFDLLMIDIMMPEMDGYEACKIIRKEEKHNLMPIIFISAKNDTQSMVNGFEVGGQDYITKPFDNAELLVRVKTQVELKKSKEKLQDYNLALEEQIAERTKDLEKAYTELSSLHKVQNKYLSFIGNEVSAPVQSINKAMELIRNSAESAKLAEMIELLDSSVGKLQTITHMAKQITQINDNREVNKNEEFSLLSTLESVLFDMDDKLDERDITIEIELDSDINIVANCQLVKKSFISIFANVFKDADNGIAVKIGTIKEGDFLKLYVKTNISNWHKNNDNTYPEDTLLSISYAETIMTLQGGKFKVDKNNLEYSLNWFFEY